MAARWSLILAALILASTPNAQQQSARSECGANGPGLRRPAHVCEMLEIAMPATEILSVDAHPNGGIRVSGEDRRDLLIRARVEAWAEDEAEAKRIANEVVIHSDGSLRAEGPGQYGRAGWSVSYEILTPRTIDLSLETQNGSIAVTGVHGDVTLETLNGEIEVGRVGGNVRGRTTNGSIEASLTGDAWDGGGLDLRTTNGGIRLRLPKDYSARLETNTVNGHVDLDFPLTVQGRIDRSISTTLGTGGATVRATTTNGHVRVTH